jgi:hypothetical protein
MIEFRYTPAITSVAAASIAAMSFSKRSIRVLANWRMSR